MVESGSTRQSPGRSWAVVTGASSGLGREFALALAERGHPVLAVARRGERLRLLAETVRAGGGQLEPLIADLSTAAGIDALLARASELEIDLLVNNAGLASYGAFSSLSGERERQLVRVNIEAVVAITRGLLPAMVERQAGGIINVASQMAFQPMPYFASYGASKAFVLSLSEAIAEELRGTGVCVTAVAPGFVSTEFTAIAGSQEPERRFPHLQPREVVDAAVRANERGKAVEVVGGLYLFLTLAGRFAPRAALRWLMGRAMRPPAPTTAAAPTTRRSSVG